MTDHPGAGDGPPEPPGPPGPPEVGNVGEEAAKLLGALSEWARDSSGGLGAGLGAGLGPGLGQSISGLAGHAAHAVSEVNEHLATGAPECTYCPVCRTVHVVRAASPEVKAHLATAASSFLQALAGVLASLPAGAAGSAPGTEFEKIDLDGDDDD